MVWAAAFMGWGIVRWRPPLCKNLAMLMIRRAASHIRGRPAQPTTPKNPPPGWAALRELSETSCRI